MVLESESHSKEISDDVIVELLIEGLVMLVIQQNR